MEKAKSLTQKAKAKRNEIGHSDCQIQAFCFMLLAFRYILAISAPSAINLLSMCW